MRIHPVVNVSQIVQYREQVGGQKRKEVKLIKVEGEKEWKVKRILNKRKVRDKKVSGAMERIYSRA